MKGGSSDVQVYLENTGTQRKILNKRFKINAISDCMQTMLVLKE